MGKKITASYALSLNVYIFSVVVFYFWNVMIKQDLDTLNFTVLRTDIKPGKIDTCLLESH